MKKARWYIKGYSIWFGCTAAFTPGAPAGILGRGGGPLLCDIPSADGFLTAPYWTVTRSPLRTIGWVNFSTPPPPHYTPATTPTTAPTPQQHGHQQWRNEHTHTRTMGGSPGQHRAAQKRRLGHRGPWVMCQQTLYRGGSGGRRILPRPNCRDAYKGELAPVLNP